MCPLAKYVIGHEKRVGREGNAPVLLWDLLPIELALFIPIVAWDFPFLPGFEFTVIGVILVALMLIVIGLSIFAILQFILTIRFRNPYHNTELELLINKAKTRMGYSSNPEIWLYSSSKQILLPLSALLFKAIVLSKPAVDDLLASPEDGEIVLADVLISLEGRPMPSTWGPLVAFVLLSLIKFPWIGLSDQTARGILWFFLLVFVLIMGYAVMRPHRQKKDPVRREYHAYSDSARCVVFRNEQPSETELKEIIKQSQQPFLGPESRKRSAVSLIIAVTLCIIAWSVTQDFVERIGLNTNPFWAGPYIPAPFLAALCTLVVVSFSLEFILARGESNQIEDV